MRVTICRNQIEDAGPLSPEMWDALEKLASAAVVMVGCPNGLDAHGLARESSLPESTQATPSVEPVL